ncbi:MAG: hypothetical protein J6B85_02230 [Lachnospiraceae bacterium]|nr:hypothetical protein [Lachnospiraceae bacterium]
MTKEIFDEILETLNEESDGLADYLEISYDEMDELEIGLWYEAVTGEKMELGEKEDMHQELLEAVYELEESDIGQLVKLVKKAKTRFAKVYGW